MLSTRYADSRSEANIIRDHLKDRRNGFFLLTVLLVRRCEVQRQPVVLALVTYFSFLEIRILIWLQLELFTNSTRK